MSDYTIDINTDSVLTVDNTWSLVEPNHTVTFHNTDNEMVGELDFNTSELKFKGNAEESAQVFIDWIILKWGKINE